MCVLFLYFSLRFQYHITLSKGTLAPHRWFKLLFVYVLPVFIVFTSHLVTQLSQCYTNGIQYHKLLFCLTLRPQNHTMTSKSIVTKAVSLPIFLFQYHNKVYYFDLPLKTTRINTLESSKHFH